tara:strand:- start:2798 stop:3580 length:783 start_codon:yes stop_codon:yes gene_type:complete
MHQKVIHTNNMKTLINELIKLNKEFNVVGIKQSTEDEGAYHDDIITMRRITESCGLKLSVKIGGCEAKTDIDFCNTIGVNGIVAPMVESEFAMQKFIESTIDIKDIKYYINIESKTAYKNLSNILKSPSSKLLSGIVIGRSDLVKSYGRDKNQVDDEDMNLIVQNILTQCTEYGLNTLMGGNISPNSSEFIKSMYDKKLLQFIETRNVIIKLNDKNSKNISDVIKSSLMFESDWLQYKSDYHTLISDKYKNRSTQLMNRL